MEKLKTPPLLYKTIRTTLSQWLADPDFSNPVRTPQIRSDHHLSEGIRAQNEIGWKNFFSGFIAKSFQYCYNSHNHDRPMNSYESNKWTISITKLIREYIEAQWKTRYECIHGNDPTSRYEARRSKALREIETIYKLKDQVDQTGNPAHKVLLSRPIEQFQNERAFILEQWIHTVKPTVLTILKLDDLPIDLEEFEAQPSTPS